MNQSTKLERGTISQCLMCGRDFYDKVLDKCPNCGGLCNRFAEHDITFMERHQTRGEIYLNGETRRP